MPFSMNVRLLADSGSADVVSCNHGLWNATANTCDCASGWATDWTNQDILGGGIVYCNSRASTPAPGNTTAVTNTGSNSPLATPWIIVIVVAAVAAVVTLGVVCFCCCCKRRHSSGDAEEQRRRKEQQDSEELQRRSQELQRRQQEDEALWNSEAMLRRQMWDPKRRWQPCSESTMPELWEGSYSSLAGATPDPRSVSREAPSSFSLPPAQMGTEWSGSTPFTDQRQRSPHATPQVQYRIVYRQPSSNLYGSDTTSFTGTADECIFTEYSDSPPPGLHSVCAVSGTTPFTTPRHAEPYDPNNPF